MRALKLNENDKDTKEARRRSGGNTSKHGLTEDGWQHRETGRQARNNYLWTEKLHNQIEAFEGKTPGKGKGTAKGKLRPRAYDDMTHCEQWWLEEFWSGRLLAEKEQAEQLCSRAQAKDFNVFRKN